jgi:drug/metabolite transporter (DMT)-like permease
MHPASPSPRAFALLLLVACLFAANHVAARFAMDHGVDVVTAVAARSLGTAAVVALIVLAYRVPWTMTARQARVMLLIGVIIAVQSVCLYSAVARIPVGVALLALQGRAILAAVGQGTIALILVVVAVGLLIGHSLGGPAPGQRWALASATVSRHPAVALVLASGAMPQHQPTVLGTVLLYLICALLLPIPLERRWRG